MLGGCHFILEGINGKDSSEWVAVIPLYSQYCQVHLFPDVFIIYLLEKGTAVDLRT